MKRVLTALVGIPIVLAITWLAPAPLFALLVGFVASFAAEEFLSLGAQKGIGRPGKWFLLFPALVTVSFIADDPELVVAALSVATLTLLTVTIFSESIETALGRVSIGLGALVYCSVSLGFLVLLSPDAILVLFAIIWVGDSAAYYAGRAFGRHRLAPRVSPKKTVEGAIAGLVGSVVAGASLGVWRLGESWAFVALISLAAAIAGQIGDLAESVLKRSAGVKDSSAILPGHGGILDRLDSLFFAAPVFYWLINLR